MLSASYVSVCGAGHLQTSLWLRLLTWIRLKGYACKHFTTDKVVLLASAIHRGWLLCIERKSHVISLKVFGPFISSINAAPCLKSMWFHMFSQVGLLDFHNRERESIKRHIKGLFFAADILTCRRRKSTGVTDNMNNGSVQLKWPTNTFTWTLIFWYEPDYSLSKKLWFP